MKELLLVGGGHSHLAVLKNFGDDPEQSARLTLLSPHRHAYYSGMVPGVIAGHYGLADCRIDLGALAIRAGARFLQDSAIGADPARREVLTAKGERLRYDILSLDVGSAAPEHAPAADHAFCVRPIEAFLAAWERLRERAGRDGIHRIAVVGGGAAGIEVLLAMQHSLRGSVQFALFDAAPLLDGRGAGRRIERLLRTRGVAVYATRVLRASEGGLVLDGGGRFPAQATVWATGASAPSWIGRSGLATDADGFVAVRPSLQSTSHPEVFAAGDVASAVGRARPKSGVLAVRQGPVLARNLRRALAGREPEAFRARQRTLALISCGGRYAVASWGGVALEGAWVWRWKDRIDRRFVEGYKVG